MVGCNGDKGEEKALKYNNVGAVDGGKEERKRRESVGKEEGEIRERGQTSPL